MKVSLSSIKVPGKVLYATAAALVVVAVVIISLAVSEHQSRVQAAQDAQKTQATETQLDSLKADNGQLRASNEAISGKLSRVCSYITSLSLNKAAKPAVIVPVDCK